MTATATIIPILPPAKQMLSVEDEKLVEVIAEVVVEMVLNQGYNYG